MVKAFLEKESEEVFYVRGDTRIVTQKMLDFLIDQALRNPRHRCRLCLHDNPQSEIHDMIIVQACDVFVTPHMHKNKNESFMLLSGLATLYYLNDKCHPESAILMGAQGTGRALSARIPSGVWHTQRFESNIVIYQEVTSGPFRKDDMVTLWDINDPNHEKRAAMFLNQLMHWNLEKSIA